MIRLDFSTVRYGSQLDEKHLFAWAAEIPAVVRCDPVTLFVRSRRISDASLRDLIALFERYDIPMNQLQVFLSDKNQSWFANPKMYWYKKVFSKPFNFSLDTAAPRRSA
jgi:hypothetical protein